MGIPGYYDVGINESSLLLVHFEDADDDVGFEDGLDGPFVSPLNNLNYCSVSGSSSRSSPSINLSKSDWKRRSWMTRYFSNSVSANSLA